MSASELVRHPSLVLPKTENDLLQPLNTPIKFNFLHKDLDAEKTISALLSAAAVNAITPFDLSSVRKQSPPPSMPHVE